MIGRTSIILIFSTVISSFLTALPVVFGTESVPFLVFPFVLTYAVFYLSPVEGAVVAILLGAIYDLMAGTYIGAYMAIGLSMWFFARALSSTAGRPDGILFLAFIFGLSFLFRIWTLVIFSLFSSQSANWEWFAIIIGPAGDALFGVVALNMLHKLLVLLRQAEAFDDVGTRLKARRI